jgi:SAM-dependent MidA family methyltransferase
MSCDEGPGGTVPVPAGIAGEIMAEGGRVTFARFMELALTHQTEGYYRRTGRMTGPLLGRRGDFSTAPRLSPAFRRAVGRLLTELVDVSLAHTGQTDGPAVSGPSDMAAFGRSPVGVIELGGGEGDLAAAVLEGWEEARPDLRERVAYSIVEIGGPLRERQQQACRRMTARGWEVRWAEDLARAVAGVRPAVIVGNEFVDALPVHLIDVRSPGPVEAWIVADTGGSGGVSERWEGLSEEAEAEIRFLFGVVPWERLRDLSRDGIVELRPAVGELMRRVAASMPEGSLLTIDYGGWFEGVGRGIEGRCGQACRPRYGRTLRGYFRHQLVTDPYLRVGRQDLTADVDFRALDLHGREAGFETALYTSVATLLLADGGETELRALREEAGISLDADREATVLEALLDEEGLGGAFKVMLQVRE